MNDSSVKLPALALFESMKSKLYTLIFLESNNEFKILIKKLKENIKFQEKVILGKLYLK